MIFIKILSGSMLAWFFQKWIQDRKNHIWKIREIDGMFYAQLSRNKFLCSRILELRRFKNAEGFKTFKQAEYAIIQFDRRHFD